MKPKIKDTMAPVYINNKIVFGTQSTSIEIEDDNGEIFQLIEMFTGNMEIHEIYKKTLIDKEVVDEIIEVLNDNLLIEDANLDRELLSVEENKRYNTNLNYFSNYANLSKSKYKYQKKLIDSTVAVIGVGGASLLATSLANMGIGKIVLVDFDIIELSNLSRQIPYFENDIGRFKIDVAKEKINSINSSVIVETFNKKIVGAKELNEIIKDADIVVNGIDTPAIESARWVNYACRKNNKVMLQGGIGSDCIIIEKFTNSTGCYDCFLMNSLKNDKEFEAQLRHVYSDKFNNVNTSYVPNIIMLTGLLAFEIGKNLGEYGQKNDLDYTIELNTNTLQLKYINSSSRHIKCPTCGVDNSAIEEPVSIEELIKIVKGIEI